VFFQDRLCDTQGLAVQWPIWLGLHLHACMLWRFVALARSQQRPTKHAHLGHRSTLVGQAAQRGSPRAGNPKGVVITHATLLACTTGLQGYMREVNVDIRPGDAILSYLTLAHIFGRAVEEFCLSVGAAIGYWQARARRAPAARPAMHPWHTHV